MRSTDLSRWRARVDATATPKETPDSAQALPNSRLSWPLGAAIRQRLPGKRLPDRTARTTTGELHLDSEDPTWRGLAPHRRCCGRFDARFRSHARRVRAAAAALLSWGRGLSRLLAGAAAARGRGDRAL